LLERFSSSFLFCIFPISHPPSLPLRPPSFSAGCLSLFLSFRAFLIWARHSPGQSHDQVCSFSACASSFFFILGFFFVCHSTFPRDLLRASIFGGPDLPTHYPFSNSFLSFELPPSLVPFFSFDWRMVWPFAPPLFLFRLRFP